MCSQDEEDAKEVKNPGQRVNKVPASRCVCGGEAVFEFELSSELFLCDIIFLSSSINF